MLEINGLQFISCPWPENIPIGGAAIVVSTEKFFCKKLNVMVSGNSECGWAMLRPKNITRETKYKGYICEVLLPSKEQEKYEASGPHDFHAPYDHEKIS